MLIDGDRRLSQSLLVYLTAQYGCICENRFAVVDFNANATKNTLLAQT